MIGTAVGDSLGLPAENLSRERIKKFYNGSWHQRFLPGLGVTSDDTDHTCFVAQALLYSPEDTKKFTYKLSWALRSWLFSLPIGIGFATLRSLLKLCVGFSPDKSGVHSAGNGPAMRVAIIGSYFADNPDKLNEYVRASTRITHTDPKAYIGAMAVAKVAALCTNHNERTPPAFKQVLDLITFETDDDEWGAILEHLRQADEKRYSVYEFCRLLKLEKGVSGYVYHTVPVAIWAWYNHFGHYKDGVESCLNAGGDTDTVAAIAGALLGINVGAKAIEEAYPEKIIAWPYTKSVMERICLNLDQKEGVVAVLSGALLVRNLLSIPVVVLHILRRLGPPF